MLSFEVGDARIEVDPACGGRLSSLRVAGLELLLPRRDDPVRWGCYPMAPFAGRVRRGRFRFAGVEHALPLRLPPHAIHGTVLDRAWQHHGQGRLEIALGEDWPFPGRALQEFELLAGELRLRLEVHAERGAFPASLGWHPWFRRSLGREIRSSSRSRREMYRRDGEGIPTGERVTPGPGPHDDCFTAVVREPGLRWPGALALELSSDLDHWVIYDQPEDAVCVEPQSGPPDALNLAPRLVEPGRPLRGEFRLRWQVA